MRLTVVYSGSNYWRTLKDVNIVVLAVQVVRNLGFLGRVGLGEEEEEDGEKRRRRRRGDDDEEEPARS